MPMNTVKTKRSRTNIHLLLGFRQFLLLLLILPAVAQAQFYYETNNGAITITGYFGPGGDVTIPATIDGLPVTHIGDNAFASSGLTSIVIPNSVTSIGDRAFLFCSGLTSVVIGGGVTSIGGGAFAGCFSLTSMVIPGSVKSIGGGAFYNCSGMTSVVIGTGVTNIGAAAFQSCSSLTSIVIPDSVTSIGGGPYAYNSGAFAECSSLTSVVIGKGVTSIADNAFYACPSVTNFAVAADNSAYRSTQGVLFDKNQTRLLQYPVGSTNTIYVVPDSVTTISDYAFLYGTNLTSVVIGNLVTNVGFYAFAFCPNLTSAYFRGDAPSFGQTVFDSGNPTLYYLPGTVGWTATVAGRPTQPWFLPNPTILTGSPSFGMSANAFGFRVSWATNVAVVVEACTNLFAPVWSPLATNTLTGGWTYFSDPAWTNYPSRLYRVRSQ